jgi:hypothetical protein
MECWIQLEGVPRTGTPPQTPPPPAIGTANSAWTCPTQIALTCPGTVQWQDQPRCQSAHSAASSSVHRRIICACVARSLKNTCTAAQQPLELQALGAVEQLPRLGAETFRPAKLAGVWQRRVVHEHDRGCGGVCVQSAAEPLQLRRTQGPYAAPLHECVAPHHQPTAPAQETGTTTIMTIVQRDS